MIYYIIYCHCIATKGVWIITAVEVLLITSRVLNQKNMLT